MSKTLCRSGTGTMGRGNTMMCTKNGVLYVWDPDTFLFQISDCSPEGSSIFMLAGGEQAHFNPMWECQLFPDFVSVREH